MNQLPIPSDVTEIQNWLNPEFYKITTRYKPDNIYIINALRGQDDNIFELNIEYSSERNTVLLIIHRLKEINPGKYNFCIELLNYLNVHKTESNFSINPLTMRLTCSEVIGFASYEAGSSELTDTLEICSTFAFRNLINISAILDENIGLQEAVERTIGFVQVEYDITD